eukprot:symbB.v1.2.035749.t1/scaffold4888.1/size33416/1
MKLIKASSSSVKSCHRLGDAAALVLDLKHLQAHKQDGHAYELPLPDYVVADEEHPGLEHRSTLQLFVALEHGELQPLGPAHSPKEMRKWEEQIVAAGGGAYRHWREAMTRGFEHTGSRLWFSTPQNVALKDLSRLVAVVFPMAPKMGFVEVVHKPDKKAKEYDPTKRRRRKEIHRELFFETFPTLGVEPHLAERPEETLQGVQYLWRTSHHDEFNMELQPGEIYEKRMPYAFAEYFGRFEKSGAVLFPPPACYQYYENKVALTRLFQESNVLMPETWVFSSLADAMAHRDQVNLPVVLKDPYGYSSIGLLQAENTPELIQAFQTFFTQAKPGVEVLVQKKVRALKEARVTYVDGRPFHGYWRIRQSLKSASAASTRGGFQDFNFPLETIAPFVQNFANKTGVPVGGVDLIWKDNPDVQQEPYTLEVSPTSDINPPSPPDWKEGYAEFKHTKGFRNVYLRIRRKWAEAMALAVLDRHRRSKRHLFIGMETLFQNSEVAPDALDVLLDLRRSFFIRLLVLAKKGQKDPVSSTLGSLQSHKLVQFDDVIFLQNSNHRISYLDPTSLLLDFLDKDSEKQLQELMIPFLNIAELSWKEVPPQIARLPSPSQPSTAKPPTIPAPTPPPSAQSLQPQPTPSPSKRTEVLERGDCPSVVTGRASWRQVPSKDLEIIQEKTAEDAVVKKCERRGQALVFHLNLLKAEKIQKNAYEMPFPRFIIADEFGSWRSKRSTLQLFSVDSNGAFHPLGPAHSSHENIAEKGNGAFSHWRHHITDGTQGKSMLRFSTRKNIPLKKVQDMVAVVHPMVPPMGWIEFTEGKHVNHEELFREMFLQTFPTVGVSRPHLIDRATETISGVRYMWRVGGAHEFELPLQEGELYEKRLPYQIAEWYAQFSQRGGILYPPPETYVYYQNKVGLAKLFNERKVKIPATWVFSTFEEAEAEQDNVQFPVVIKDPYGYSSLGLMQAANKEEFLKNVKLHFEHALPGVETIVQSKVVALREARVTYIEGRPFHAYWRIRKSLDSASAASNLGGFQDFDFPMRDIAPYVARFANKTGIPVGGVDFIWEAEDADVKTTPYTLEVSPTSDINPFG